MARSVAEINADLTKLRELRASGELSVRHRDGTSVTNQSLAEIEKSIARLEKELADATAAANGRRRRRVFRAYQSGTGL